VDEVGGDEEQIGGDEQEQQHRHGLRTHEACRRADLSP
jgi:hypothetical protein